MSDASTALLIYPIVSQVFRDANAVIAALRKRLSDKNDPEIQELIVRFQTLLFELQNSFLEINQERIELA